MTRKAISLSPLLKGAIVLGACLAVAWTGAEALAATVTANATATLGSGLAIAKVADLSFGTASPGLTGGTIVMATDGTRTKAGTVTLSGLDVGEPASFTVTGTADSTYTITLPLTTALSNGALGVMTVTDFTSNPSGTGTLTGGTQTVNVGATLNVGLAQALGVYTGTFDVTVEYN